MKLKLSIIAAAMVFAGQANAAITTNAGFSDDLFLSVWDPVAQTSYTKGLGITMTQFDNGANIVWGSSTNGSGFTAGADTNSVSIAADAGLTSFLSAASAAGDTSSVVWNVVSGDVTAGPVYGGTGFMTTSTGALPQLTDQVVSTMNGFPSVYLSSVNGMMPSGSVMGNTDSISTTAAVGGAAYANATSNGFGNNFGNAVTFYNTGALDSNLNFSVISEATGSRSYNGYAKTYEFANTWNLSSGGLLTYNAASVAAVPEPGEWALMLSGFGLFGFIAKRRQARMA